MMRFESRILTNDEFRCGFTFQLLCGRDGISKRESTQGFSVAKEESDGDADRFGFTVVYKF